MLIKFNSHNKIKHILKEASASKGAETVEAVGFFVTVPGLILFYL
jgi:hypothetical protein